MVTMVGIAIERLLNTSWNIMSVAYKGMGGRGGMGREGWIVTAAKRHRQPSCLFSS